MLDQRISGFLGTPSLWVGNQFGIAQFEFPDLNMDEFKQTPIPENRRLGHQMEAVCHQLLAHSTTYDVVGNNLIIKEGLRTLGEIDFILRQRSTGQVLHVELAYKFYVVNPAISEPIHRLMGPNKRDMFFTKLEKLKNRQFALLHRPQGKAVLLKKGIAMEKIAPMACFKTQLFMPYGNNQVSIRPLNKNCVTGYWVRFERFNTSIFKQQLYYMPSKTAWPIAPHSEVTWLTHNKIIYDLNLRMIQQNSPMLWIKKKDGSLEKCFVVWW